MENRRISRHWVPRWLDVIGIAGLIEEMLGDESVSSQPSKTQASKKPFEWRLTRVWDPKLERKVSGQNVVSISSFGQETVAALFTDRSLVFIDPTKEHIRESFTALLLERWDLVAAVLSVTLIFMTNELRYVFESVNVLQCCSANCAYQRWKNSREPTLLQCISTSPWAHFSSHLSRNSTHLDFPGYNLTTECCSTGSII